MRLDKDTDTNNLMRNVKKQPETILKGDCVMIMREVGLLKEFMGNSFLVGEIANNQDHRNYKITYYNGKPVNLEEKQYWTKREFIEVVHRYKGKDTVYYKVNYYDEREYDLIADFIKWLFKRLFKRK